MKLHLGCGDKILNGFTNVDLRDSEGVDVVDDVRTLETIDNGSVEVIYASHVLEHIGRHEYKVVLKRWYEVLKDGGILRLGVPDFEKIVIHYTKHRDIQTLMGLLYGGQTYENNYHYCGFDFYSLSDDLKSLGFKDVYRYDWRETDHAHIDDFTQCYLPHMDKENGTLMSLNVEAIK